MAASSLRGLQVIKSLEHYVAETKNFDSTVILKNMKFVTASDGFLKGSFTVKKDMCNCGGSAHGGFLASVVDSLGFISHMTHPTCKLGWTTSMTVNYLKPANIGDQISVDAELLKVGKVSICETTLKNQYGVVLVKGLTTFAVADDAMDAFVRRAMYMEEKK